MRICCYVVLCIASKIVSFQEIQIKHGKSERILFGHSTNANFTAIINLVRKMVRTMGKHSHDRRKIVMNVMSLPHSNA